MPSPVILAELKAKVWPTFLRSGPPTLPPELNSGTWLNGAARVIANTTRTYRVTGKARRSADADGTLYIGVALFDSSGSNVPGAGSQWFYGAASGAIPGTSWMTYTATFTVTLADCVMTPLVILNYNATQGTMECMELWIEDTATPDVALSHDRYMRDLASWVVYAGPAATRLTLTDGGDALTQAETLRYATAGYTTRPSDTPSRTLYPGRILQPGLMRSELQPDFTGPITATYGELVLANSDGALGDLAYYGLDGQQMTLKLGAADAPYSSFVTVMVAAMEQAVVDRQSARIRLRGADALLQRPLLQARYLGNNSLPNGLEGNSELAGQVKPRVYGGAENVSAPCVNSARYIYQVSDDFRGCAVTNAYVAGVGLTAGAAYTSQTDMETNAPSAGQYRPWPAGGMFRLGSAPTGLVTCDASAIPRGFGAPWELANVLWQIAYDAGVQTTEMAQAEGWVPPAPDNWNAAWASTQPAVGIWVNDLRTASEVMTEVAASLGAWFGFTRGTTNSLAGAPKFTVGIFPPSISSMGGNDIKRLWFDESHIISLQGIAAPGTGRGVPTWKVDLSFRQNETVFQPSMAPSLPPAGLGFLDIQNLRTSAADAGVLLKHLTAQTLVRDTRILNDRSGTTLEAQRQLALRRAPKPWFDVRVSLTALLNSYRFPLLVLGGLTYLKWPELRLVWQDGVTRAEGWFTVNALEFDWARNEMRMTVRQATEQVF